MIKAVHARDPSLELEIKPLYEGNKYYATTYRISATSVLSSPYHKSMGGKFGGETDNWMWPRCNLLTTLYSVSMPTQHQRSGCIQQAERALPSEALGLGVDGRI